MKERVLIVARNKSIRRTLATLLQDQNYQTQQAASENEAVSRIQSGDEFEMVLCPAEVSHSFLHAIKEKLPNALVVVITSKKNTFIALSAIRNGAYDYLRLPVQREEFMATVTRALVHRRTLLENHAYKINLESLVAARTEQLRRAMSDLEKSYDLTLEAMMKALELRDARAAGHSRRVTAFTIAICRAMGLSKEEISVIARGTFLHDIGSLAVPDAILKKGGALTVEERAVMREHVERTRDILSAIPFLKDSAEVAYAHHECWDGSGYPRGLRGEQIPIGARVLAIADTFDAIISDQPYRAAQSLDVARAEIRRCAGTQFDPSIVEVFLRMPDNIWEDLRREIGRDPGGADASPVPSPVKPRPSMSGTIALPRPDGE